MPGRHGAQGRPGSPVLVAATLMALLSHGCDGGDDAAAEAIGDRFTPSAGAFVALTAVEYNQTILALLGLPADPARWPPAPAIAARISPPTGDRRGLFGTKPQAQDPWPFAFPDETGVEDFVGMADGQSPSAYGVERLEKAAAHFAPYVLVSPLFFTCEGWSELQDDSRQECGWASIERFTQRAWRRPLSDDERGRLRRFFESLWAEGSPDEAVVIAIIGVLQSPGFVFRIERGDSAVGSSGAVALTDWEMASRLAYFLWDSMPDPQLFAAAARSGLSDPDGVETEARRMLDDPRAREAVVSFHHQWLGTDEVLRISPARRAFGPLFGIAPEPLLDTTDDGEWPAILGPIRHSMQAETSMFVEHAVFDGDGTLTALLTGRQGWISSHTAPLYGDGVVDRAGPTVSLEAGIVAAVGVKVGIDLTPVELPADQRAGLLTLPSVLALGAHPVHPSPILRGKRIVERVTCTDIPPPPPGAEAQAPPDVASAESTNRQRTEAVTSPEQCSGCHSTLNPPGFAFENYDAMGRWRSEDNGQPVDASGTVRIGDEEFQFDDGVELAHQLAASATVRDCYVLRWARYATGSHLAASQPGLEELREGFRQDDDVIELLVAIVKSDLFRYRGVEGEGGHDADGEER